MYYNQLLLYRRRGGLVVSAFDSAVSDPGSILTADIVLYSWARHLTLTVPLSTQIFK